MASDEEPISPDLLKKYKQTPYPAMRITGKTIEPVESEREAPLVRLMHASGKGPANMMAWGAEYIDEIRKYIPLADIDPALIQNIGRKFVETQDELEGEKTTLTKPDVVDAFATYYHLIQPDTEAARYVRTLIEETFKLLELGPIPSKTVMETQASYSAVCGKKGTVRPENNTLENRNQDRGMRTRGESSS